MEQLNSNKMRLVIVGFVVAMVLGGSRAKADFTFGEPMNLGPMVNSTVLDEQPSISADGLILYFHSERPGGYGGSDLWMTTRPTENDPWKKPVNLGPIVNSSARDNAPSISADGLSLYFKSNRPGGYGGSDIWVAIRKTTGDPWDEPVNLGPIVNSSAGENAPNISGDGLSLYFHSDLPGSIGPRDIWMTTRQTKTEAWRPPVNLGPVVNSSGYEYGPGISGDGLSLWFHSNRPGGYGSVDIWVAMRKTPGDPWQEPINLGPIVNSSSIDAAAAPSTDGSMLYLSSDRPGGFGDMDIYQAPIIPIVDLNGDGIVDAADMCIMVDHWGEDYPLCDIGPMPWGDGIVDVQDLIVLAGHLFEEFPVVE